ncbi:hypothetical protein JCM19240_5608 [Vibrio maritimus]|uniref:Lipoprotein n=1 Tax=Vibrio maritimus TaxID=990268 RepID=A0A090TLJ5_9VIBR|nr:hypothetical protein JCM19240_5608 [Vibrio maritimus]
MHLKNILSMAGMIFLLSACNSGNESNEIEQLATSINTQFAAVYSQGIKKRDLNSLNDSSEVALQSPEQQNTDKRFLGELQVVDVVAAQTQVLNWAVTLRSDGVVESHGTVALSPGTYDFKMTLERDSKQYVAESLGVEVAGDGSADILLTLLPNLADTITPEGDVEYTSTISFEYPAEDLVNLIDPKFGLILNNGDELIFDINKEVGITKFILNVDAGSHQIALNLYDGSQLVGHDTGTQAIDLSENENVTLDIISLQSDITFDVDRLVENGEFIFNVPNVIVDEVGGEENLAVLVKMAAGNNPLQEKILEVINVEGKYQASDNFVTYGENSVTVSIDYYDQAELVDGLSGLPFATCTTQISVTSSQAVTCKYFLERSSVISGRLLGSIMLNVMETNGTPAIGAEVYLNNKLVGLTGENYQHGGLKTHQVAGDYELNVVRPDGRHHSSFTLNPLQVLNLSVVLDSHFSVDEIQYVDSNKEIDLSDAYKSTQYRMRLEDFNRDGFVDIYYSRNSFNTSDVVLLNDGTGNFSSQVELERYSSQTVLEDLSPVASGVHNDETICLSLTTIETQQQ